MHYLKSHPNAQKQFGRIAAVKYSFQYSVVGTDGLSFITAFSCDCFCPLVRHGIRRPHPIAKCITSVTATLQYNWSHITWTLQHHPIYRAFSRALFEFFPLILGNALIMSSRRTTHHNTDPRTLKRSMTRVRCVLKDYKHCSQKKKRFQWALTPLVEGWEQGGEACN